MRVEMKPEIIFKREAFYRMMEYCRQAKGEITGFGTVDETPSGLLVSEVYIVPQKASPAGVLVNQDSLIEFMKWARQQGRPELVSKARLWWHSHAAFNVFRSSTDNDTISMLLGVMPYVLTVVGNHRSQYECALHYKDPRLTITNLRIKQEDYDQLAVQGEVAEDIGAMVTEWEHKRVEAPAVPAHDYHPPNPMHELSRDDEGQLPIWDRYPSRKDDVTAPLLEDPGSKSFLEMSDQEFKDFEARQFPAQNLEFKCKNDGCNVYTTNRTGECLLCQQKREWNEHHQVKQEGD